MNTSQGRTGQPLVPAGEAVRCAEPTLAQKRIAICRQCPSRMVLPVVKTEVCGRCGCPLASKTKFTRATCPLNKW